MKSLRFARIVPISRVHIPACSEIVAASDPWKRLGERLDFTSLISDDRSNLKAYVCVVDKKTVGFIVFAPAPVFARGGYLRAIGVSPSMHRLGIGAKLLTYAEKTTSLMSPNFYLCVSSFNRRAQAFYKKQGYTRVGKIPDLLVRGSSEYIYWKRLR